MLQNIKELYGNKLAASDGDIGHIKDFYFDDKIWVIRYLVADTGSWLTGRLVLLSPHAFGKFDPLEKTLHVKLLKKQIENSPSIESHKPVSRQYEVEYYRYYGWPAYWNGGAMWGLGGYPVAMPPSKDEMEAAKSYEHNPIALHLRAMNMLYEGLKENATIVIVPSTAVESMELGGLSGVTALTMGLQERASAHKEAELKKTAGPVTLQADGESPAH